MRMPHSTACWLLPSSIHFSVLTGLAEVSRILKPGDLAAAIDYI